METLHSKIVKAFKELPAGAKKRLEMLGHKQQHTDYILKNESYGNDSKMLLLLQAMKQASSDVYRQVKVENQNIQKI